MKALIFDKKRQSWDKSRGFLLADVPKPKLGPNDSASVIIKVRYAGVCGSDKGIWYRTAFGEQILNSLKAEKKSYRIIGHEFCGDIVETGRDVKKKYGFKPGDFVSAESHLVCNKCYQCLRGEKNVCTNEKILGISHDGCFAEYIKAPAHIVWKNNAGKIRTEVAAVQEPFGNAVHAASKAPLKGQNVVISGLGPIGLFVLIAAKGLGAKKIIGIQPPSKTIAMAKRLGISEVISLKAGKDYHHDPAAVKRVLQLTGGVGADVSFEMSGANSSLNNSIFATRRGGHVILFGIKSGDAILENYNQLIVRGQTLHAVIGRQVFATWEITKRLMENKSNGVQNSIWNVILNRGRGTILPIDDYTPKRFEQMLTEHPKFLIKF
jgi:threonine 3-dehydrogenase